MLALVASTVAAPTRAVVQLVLPPLEVRLTSWEKKTMMTTIIATVNNYFSCSYPYPPITTATKTNATSLARSLAPTPTLAAATAATRHYSYYYCYDCHCYWYS